MDIHLFVKFRFCLHTLLRSIENVLNSIVTERFISLLPIKVGDGELLCGNSVMYYDKNLFTVTLGSEEVERKQGKTGTVYYADLAVINPTQNMKFEFVFD